MISGACHAKAAAAPAAATHAAARPGGSVYCACHAKGSRGPSGSHARRSSSRRLCVLRLLREREPRPQQAATRAAARPGGSVYCACHAKGSRGPSGGHARGFCRRVCVVRLPRESSVHCACHAKGSRGLSGGHARRSSSRRLCVLRLPHERQSADHGAVMSCAVI